MSRKIPMTDARLDRTSAAWHREFDTWGLRNNALTKRYEIFRLEPDSPICDRSLVVHHTVKRGDLARINAEAWLNTYRDRAAARAALEAALPSQNGTKP